MDSLTLLVVGGGILLYAAVSRPAQAGIVTPPMMAALFGILVGPGVLDLADIALDRAFINGLAEVTLVIVLFTDAARIDLGRLRREHDLPLRMLGIGLPLTILAGFLVARLLLPQLSVWEAAILATILAPTDAALGQAVVNNGRVPARIRQALNVESGLNDGLALPALLFFLAALEGQAGGASHWVRYVILQLLIGPLAGAAVGFAGSRLIAYAARRRWINEVFLQISVLSLAVLAYGGAQVLHGNGFIAAFAAGLTVGASSRELAGPVRDFGEAEGELLSLVTFLIFGASMVPMAFADLSLASVAYALLSLTVVRMLPVALSVAGVRLRPVTVGFLGWFGPRGLASILYLLLLYEQGETGAHGHLFGVVVLTVLLSIVLHGITAAPAARGYGDYIGRLGHPGAPGEHRPVPEFPVRLPWRS